MAKSKKPKDSPQALNPPNPEGKGGFQERPHDIAPGHVGAAAFVAKLEEKKAEKAILFREHQNMLKQNMLDLATGANNEAVRAKVTKDILDYVAQGSTDGVLEKSDSDEFGTLDEKLKQISDVYIEAQLKNQELEKKIAKLKELLKSQAPKGDTNSSEGRHQK